MKHLTSPHFAADGLTPLPRIRLHVAGRKLVECVVANVLRRLPPGVAARPSALVLAALTVVALPGADAFAQKRGDRVRVLSGSAMRTAPGGEVVGVLSRVYEAPVELVQGTSVRLRLNGYISEGDVRLQPNGARGLVGGGGTAGGTVRIGRGEKEPALATLQRGAVVFPGQRAEKFVAVNRPIWVDKSRLAKFSGPGAEKPVTRPAPSPVVPKPDPAPQKTPPVAPPTPVPARTTAPVTAVNGPPMQLSTASQLRSSPNGNPLFPLPAATVVTPLNSANGWTRVRVDGWVPTAELADLDNKGATGISAADLRADPEGMKGRIVRWTVENLSYQLGDGLRRELNGEPYLLARGPGTERAILYLAVPDSLVTAARALAPLSTVTITAKVRSGRSEPGGVPILDILELVRR